MRCRARHDLRRSGAKARVIADQHAAQRLEIGGIGVRDAEVAQLQLRLGPGKRRGAGEGRGVPVAVNQVKTRIRRISVGYDLSAANGPEPTVRAKILRCSLLSPGVCHQPAAR